ncbi:DUF3054 domain-containing protein [Brachybacterium huguangmaarense]
MKRAVLALVLDALAILVFVVIGLSEHGLVLDLDQIVRVAWTFAVGMLLGHLAIRAWRAPFALWPQGVFVWAITIVTAMALRTLFRAGTELSFILVTCVVLGVLMLGWRAVASWIDRRRSREVLTEADLSERAVRTDPQPERTTPAPRP